MFLFFYRYLEWEIAVNKKTMSQTGFDRLFLKRKFPKFLTRQIWVFSPHSFFVAIFFLVIIHIVLILIKIKQTSTVYRFMGILKLISSFFSFDLLIYYYYYIFLFIFSNDKSETKATLFKWILWDVSSRARPF